jgi:regulator of sigma E protease
MELSHLGMILLLVIGFGFVIFWHELGHFLAAKWAGVKVEQFAVGFGQALFSWRKGLGFRRGSSREEYEQRLRKILQEREANIPKELADASEERRLDYAADQIGLGETEYRLNWIPLGGYVKMLGQDDMDPNALSDSPRSYNNRPIYKRMIIVSAGVVMNIILAIFLFAVLFRIGFDVPPPMVGAVQSGSPAQQAGVKVGDRVVSFDGVYQHDFTKISMNVALVQEDQPVQMVVQSPDGTQRPLTVTPRRSQDDTSGFLRLGIEPALELRGIDPKKLPPGWDDDRDLVPSDFFAIQPGETITAINGEAVGVKDFYKLDRALQSSFGKPVVLSVDGPGGQRQVSIQPVFAPEFGSTSLDFAGMVPRAQVETIFENSSARGKLQPGDVVLSLTIKPANDTYTNLSLDELRERLLNASKSDSSVDLEVLRGDKTVKIEGLTAQTKLSDSGKRGLGISEGYDGQHAVVGAVTKDSTAERAKIPDGATILSINQQPVQSWYDVHRILAAITEPTKIEIRARSDGGESTYTLDLNQDDLSEIHSIQYMTRAVEGLHELSEPRQTSNPLLAARWGVGETRDLIVQFYLTLRRMIQGSVAASNAMGPVGIFTQGSKIANRGFDWLIWFLAMISANLAVVNFLPIPIVDGGLFVFLLLEKIMRKPLSPRVQSIAQIVGLALIASVFLFVTYHDISRLIF